MNSLYQKIGKNLCSRLNSTVLSRFNRSKQDMIATFKEDNKHNKNQAGNRQQDEQVQIHSQISFILILYIITISSYFFIL